LEAYKQVLGMKKDKSSFSWMGQEICKNSDWSRPVISEKLYRIDGEVTTSLIPIKQIDFG
jgi:hypothetical protein